MELIKTYLDLTVFGLLGLMGFIALWVTVERIIFYRNLRLESYDQQVLLNIDLTRNLTILSTIGANTPFVGLLGTVIGILITFYDIGQNQAIETGAIMVGLALALKATAAGIAIAIPTIIAYNGLLRKVEVINSLYSIHQPANPATKTL
ncbi:biopolymer transport protein ExbB [Thiomicrorhabdus immobilis]|uniref:Biopolymer transport protein ExbB n=1 Tax=Thiomicrorhabdus immobilis TaxID=2791037 RepID=A0ABN6CV54_9GAMM|nr:TonB-system energizer ExbB [Thiomicrorhabdus immobilis]BCN92890.1 biopolymer transport protein ExbB [Thiomicrorhabdus immobilis]